MNKKLLSTAVATTLGAVIAAPAAQANDYFSALIPYVVKDANRTTVVTLIGDGWANSSGGPLHLQYWTKSTTDANTSACQPSSVTIPITPRDIVSFDTAGLLGYPLFGDTSNPAPLGTSIGYPSPRHGYLVAEFQSGFGEGAYWLELDLANGGAIGDAGITTAASAYWWDGTAPYPNYGDNFAIGILPAVSKWDLVTTSGSPWVGSVQFYPLQGLTPSAWPMYTAANEYLPEGARSVSFWPTSIASTAFVVTPLGTAMASKENNAVVLQVLNGNGVQGAYDRNENGIDGTVPVTVRCVGRVSPSQLMPGVVSNAAWAAQGGWGFLHNLGNNDTNWNELYGIASIAGSTPDNMSYSFGTIVANDLPAMIYQVDSSSAGGKFMTNATRIESKSTAMSIFGYDWTRNNVE